jgi:hypothetical protein
MYSPPAGDAARSVIRFDMLSAAPFGLRKRPSRNKSLYDTNFPARGLLQ